MILPNTTDVGWHIGHYGLSLRTMRDGLGLSQIRPHNLLYSGGNLVGLSCEVCPDVCGDVRTRRERCCLCKSDQDRDGQCASHSGVVRHNERRVVVAF